MLDDTKPVDFSKFPVSMRNFDGRGSCEKKKRIINDEVYLVKFPEPIRKEDRKNGFSYRSSPYSEYIGSHIYSLLGIPSQETIIGTDVSLKGREFTVVGCKDIRENWQTITPFSKIREETDKSRFRSDKKSGPRLDKVLEIIKDQKYIESDSLLRRFWNMFIIDAMLMNADRHSENWGILTDRENINVSLCPIFDCGSSLGAIMEDSLKFRMARNPAAFIEEWIGKTSALTENGHKIYYPDFLGNKEKVPKECRQALLRILPIIRVKMPEIGKMIDNMPILDDHPDLRRIYYKTMIQKRKELILERSAKELGISNQIDIYEEKLRKMMANGQPLPCPDRKDMLLAMIMAPDKEKMPEKETAKRKPSGKGGHDSIDF